MSEPRATALAILVHSLFAHDPAGTFLLGLDTRVLAWNAAATRLWQIDADTATGRPFDDLDISYRLPGLRAAVADILAGAGPVDLGDVALPRRRPPGVATVRVAPAMLDGELAGVLVHAADVTGHARLAVELRLTEDELDSTRRDLQASDEALAVSNEELQVMNAQLRETNDQLTGRLAELDAAQAADRQKNDFLAMLAHELRTPLAPILSAVHILRRMGGDDPVVAHAREIVERQARHQARLLDDLLDLARITRGKVELRREVVSLGEAVSDAVDASHGLADDKGQQLTVTLPAPPVFVDADPTRLTQIVANLVHNAVKYTPNGGGISIVAERDRETAVVRVHDTGIGIPAHILPRIFDPFTQAEPSLARTEGGLGIGLTLVRSLVEMHGGTVGAHSDGAGKGSEFTIRLPLAAPPAPVAARPEPTAPPHRVLIIEDNGDTRTMLRGALEIDGHLVEEAEDGAQGVELALAHHPDVVIIDIGLPGLDGYEVARRVRAARGQGVLLVAVTGYGQRDDRRRSQSAGFDVHLVKPVAPETLSALLAQRSGPGVA